MSEIPRCVEAKAMGAISGGLTTEEADRAFRAMMVHPLGPASESYANTTAAFRVDHVARMGLPLALLGSAVTA